MAPRGVAGHRWTPVVAIGHALALLLNMLSVQEPEACLYLYALSPTQVQSPILPIATLSLFILPVQAYQACPQPSLTDDMCRTCRAGSKKAPWQSHSWQWGRRQLVWHTTSTSRLGSWSHPSRLPSRFATSDAYYFQYGVAFILSIFISNALGIHHIATEPFTPLFSSRPDHYRPGCPS